jgi:hypothetical protein
MQVQTEAEADLPHTKNEVTVTYNGKPLELRRGRYSVVELRNALGVPGNEVLAEFINGEFRDLIQGEVHIKGGEVFASHRPQGGAS